MDWVMLALGGWCAVWVINSYFPRLRPPTLAAVSFFAGWLTTEIALHHLVWIAAAGAALIAGGALAAWPGWVGLTLLAASELGLAVSYYRSGRTLALVEQALGAGLGEGYAQWREGADDRVLRGTPRWTDLAIPWPLKPRDVERTRDVVFHEAGDQRLALDVYRSRDRPTGCPTLLEVHGGGWVIGDKREQGLPLMYHLARHGWTCFTANYRLSPRVTLPEMLVDVKQALRWVREEGPRYGADPGFVVLTGGSAGAHLAALAALTANRPEYQPGFEDVDTSVRGCVCFYGIYDLADREHLAPNDGLRNLLEKHVLKARFEEAPEVFDEASPIHHVRGARTPFLLLHGDRDGLAPVAGARRFHAAFTEQAEAPCCYAELRGAQHAFDVFPSLRAALAVRGATRFVSYLLDARRSTGCASDGDRRIWARTGGDAPHGGRIVD